MMDLSFVRSQRSVPDRRLCGMLTDMMPKLSDEQRLALDQQAGTPLHVIDPVKNVEYVLVPAEVYQRLRVFLEPGDFEVRDTYPAQDRALGAGGWDDPAMDIYNDYDAHRPQQP